MACWSPDGSGWCVPLIKGSKPVRERVVYDRRPLEAAPEASPVQNPVRKHLELAAALEPVGQTVAGNR